MAFCTNCGSSMDANAQFCAKCGKSATAAGAPGVAAAAPVQSYPPSATSAQSYTPVPASSGGGNVLKIVLVIVGVFVLIGILSIGGLIYTAHRIRRGIHVAQDGSNSSVDFGSFKASTNRTNARDLARKVGVDPYPGATQRGDSSEATFGKMTTATMRFTTSDSVDKVASFYKSRYPNASVMNDGSKFSLVGTDNDGTITINAQDEGGATKIDISKVSGIKIDAQPR